MGTNVSSSQISQIGSILKAKGDNVLEKLSQELKAAEEVKTVTPPTQIEAAQQAQTAYGQAAVAIDAKEKYLKEAQERLAQRTAKPDTTLQKNIDRNILRGESVRKSAKESAKVFIKAEKKAAKTVSQKNVQPLAEAATASTESVVKSAAETAKDTAKAVAPKPAAAEGAAKTGFFKRIGSRVAKFFKEGKGNILAPIKKHPKVAAAVVATLAIIGGTTYAMSGDKTPDEMQPQTEEV